MVIDSLFDDLLQCVKINYAINIALIFSEV